MRKKIGVILAVALAAVVASAVRVSAASALTCVANNDDYYYLDMPAVPQQGGNFSTSIDPYAVGNGTSDQMGGWEGVSTSNSSKNLQAGVYHPFGGSGLLVYMEVKGATVMPGPPWYNENNGSGYYRIDIGSAAQSSTYPVSIVRAGASSYYATADGYTSPTFTFSTNPTDSIYANEVIPGTTVCPTSDWLFSSPHPWSYTNSNFLHLISQWSSSQTPIFFNYYYSGEWETTFPYADCQHQVPQCSGPG